MNLAAAPNSSAADTIYWSNSAKTLAPGVNTALNKSCRPLATGWPIADNWCNANAKLMASVILSFLGVFAPSVNRSSTMVDRAITSSLLAKFAKLSQHLNSVEIIAEGVVVFYFATAITTYLVHGLLKDTENQLKAPHAISRLTISSKMISVYIWALIGAEIGGVLVLFYGVVIGIL
jgi:hypothetical protein